MARNVLEPAPVGAIDEAPAGSGEAPKRVLKPWGILMLPVELPDDRSAPGAEPAAPAAEEPPSLPPG